MAVAGMLRGVAVLDHGPTVSTHSRGTGGAAGGGGRKPSRQPMLYLSCAYNVGVHRSKAGMSFCWHHSVRTTCLLGLAAAAPAACPQPLPTLFCILWILEGFQKVWWLSSSAVKPARRGKRTNHPRPVCC